MKLNFIFILILLFVIQSLKGQDIQQKNTEKNNSVESVVSDSLILPSSDFINTINKLNIPGEISLKIYLPIKDKKK